MRKVVWGPDDGRLIVFWAMSSYSTISKAGSGRLELHLVRSCSSPGEGGLEGEKPIQVENGAHVRLFSSSYLLANLKLDNMKLKCMLIINFTIYWIASPK